MPTFPSLFNKAQKYDLTLVTRANFTKAEQYVATAHERKIEAAARMANKSWKVTYGLRGRAWKEITPFFSLAAVAKYLKTEARPGFNICPDCLVEMLRLKTTEGDPEGIRSDSKCPKCGSIYGCTKAHQYLLRTRFGSSNKKWQPLVTGDPECFVLGSNYLRSTISLLRNCEDAGHHVLSLVSRIEEGLDKLAKDHREMIRAEIKAGSIAG